MIILTYFIVKSVKKSKKGPTVDVIELPPYPKPEDNVHATLRGYFIALYPRNKLALGYNGQSIEKLSKQNLLDLYQSLICFYNPGIMNNNQTTVSDTIPSTFGDNQDNSLSQQDIDKFLKQLNLIFGGNLRQYAPNWALDSNLKKMIVDKNRNGVMPTSDGCNVYVPAGVTNLYDNSIDRCLRYLPQGIKTAYPACNGGGYATGFPYRWGGMIPVVSPMWIGSYTRMGGFPSFSLCEGYTAPGECGVPTECQGGQLGRLHVDMTDNLVYGGDPLKLPVVFPDGKRPTIQDNFWWDFGFDPTQNSTLAASAATNIWGDKNAPRQVCLPFSDCSSGTCDPKLSSTDYINTGRGCDNVQQGSGAFSATDYTDSITGKPQSQSSCCSTQECAVGNYNNFPCQEVNVSSQDKKASPFFDIFSSQGDYGYPNIGGGIKAAMNYKGYALKSGDIREDYNFGGPPVQQNFQWSEFQNIKRALNADDFGDVSVYVETDVRWYWPLKGYGVWTYLGTTHGVASKYGFLMEGSSTDSRPMNRKMMKLNNKLVPIGGGMSLDYICTAQNSNKYTYFNMDVPFQLGTGTSTYPFPAPQNPNDLKDTTKYMADTILATVQGYIKGCAFNGGSSQTYSGVFVLAKQINDLYGAVGDQSGFPGYPAGKKLTFEQCKQMVTLFNITGMIPKDGLKGCHQDNLKYMSNEVWMKQFNDGSINPNYDENLAKKFICVTEWMYNGKMMGCSTNFDIEKISPVWEKNRLYWATGTESWPVGVFFINDQFEGQCGVILGGIAADREYNSLQITCSMQGGMNVNCFVTNPYSPEILKMVCNRSLNEDGSSACYYPNKDTLPKAGTFFSKYYPDIDSDTGFSPMIRVPDIAGEHMTKGVGRYTDQEGNVNYSKSTNVYDMKYPYDVCGSSYLLDPFEDMDNYMYCGFVDVRKLNRNQSIGKGAGVTLFDNRIMRLSPYSAQQNIAAYAQKNVSKIQGTWQIVQSLPTRALGWKAFTPQHDDNFKTKIKSAVDFFDALANMLDNTKNVFYFGGNELNLLPTTEKYKKYCCIQPPQGPNTEKINKEVGNVFSGTTQGTVNKNGQRMCTDPDQNYCNNRISSDDDGNNKSMKLLNAMVNALKRGVEIIGYWRLEYTGDQSYTSWVDVHYLGKQSWSDKDTYYPKQDMGSLGTINYIYEMTSTFLVGKTGKTAWEFWKVVPGVNTIPALGWVSGLFAHSKTYVADPDEEKNATYIGSQNFTYPIGKETGLAIYNSSAVAKSAARAVGFIRYLLWYSQGNPTWDELWGNKIFKDNKQITWDIITPYFCVNILAEASRKRLAKTYVNDITAQPLQNMNGDIILDSNQKKIYNFPEKCFNYQTYMEKVPNINITDPFINSLANRDITSTNSPFNENNWFNIVGKTAAPIDPDTVKSIISACNGQGYIQTADGTVKPNPAGLNVWWKLPAVDDLAAFLQLETDMKTSGWGNFNMLCKKKPEWVGDKSTVARPIESGIDNPIYAYLTKQQDNTFWSNAAPNPNYYPEYSTVVISSSMLTCIQGRSSNMENTDYFLETTDQKLNMEMMYLFSFIDTDDNRALSNKYLHYGIVSALNRGVDVQLNLTNFKNICGSCSIPDKAIATNMTPDNNFNFISNLWVSLYGNACSQDNKTAGNINVRSFNFSAQAIPNTKCKLPTQCKDLPCNYIPTEQEEEIFFTGEDRCANDPPVPLQDYPTSSGYGLDHGRFAINEKSVFILNDDYSMGNSIGFVGWLGCGITLNHPSVVQEFQNLASRDWNSSYSFDIADTSKYPGIRLPGLRELDQINTGDPGVGYFCFDGGNLQRPCSGNNNLQPGWVDDYTAGKNSIPCSSPDKSNNYWPGTAATCFSHPSCKNVEQKLSNITYNFPGSGNSLPLFSDTQTVKDTSFVQNSWKKR